MHLYFQGELVHISGSTERILLAAELMEIKKPYMDDTLREVALDDLKQFKNTGSKPLNVFTVIVMGQIVAYLSH